MPSNNIQTVSDLFPSKWLSADDLAGRSVVVQIAQVSLEEIRQRDGKNELKAVVAFDRAHKRLILNKTQALAIAAVVRSEAFADWPGQRIQLSVGRAPNGKPTIVVSQAPVPHVQTPTQAQASETAAE